MQNLLSDTHINEQLVGRGELMQEICPTCEKYSEVELINKNESYDIRGENIEVPVEFYLCHECGEEFVNPSLQKDPLNAAYRIYRQRHNLMQPEDIKELRKQYGLNQGDLANILGWGGATLSRYENGALQDNAHARVLNLIKEPHNLLTLVEDNPEVLYDGKREQLLDRLRKTEKDAFSLERIIEINFGENEPNEFSGFKSLDLNKFYNMVLYFCSVKGVLKTVLNKLLFYADFKHFKEYTVSISGMNYARINFGPVPNNYDFFYASLLKNKLLETEEEYYSQDVVGERFRSIKQTDLGIFSNTELNIITYVIEFFKKYNATQISNFSHEEKGYKETSTGDIISYSYAEELNI